MMGPMSYCHICRCGEVAEPGLRRTPGERVDSEGSRGFESPPLRHASCFTWFFEDSLGTKLRSASGFFRCPVDAQGSPDLFAPNRTAHGANRGNQSRLTLIDWKRWTLIVTVQAGLKSANGVVITFGVAKGLSRLLSLGARALSPGF